MNMQVLNENVVSEYHDLKKHLQSFKSWQYDSYLKDSLIAVWEGDLELDGDLSLDWDEWRGEKNALIALCSESDKEKLINASGLVITGNLTLHGSLINACSNYGAFFLLKGDLNAKHLVGGGAEICICGNANIREFAWGHYNDGILDIDGLLTAKAVVNEDHCFSYSDEADVQWRNDWDEGDGNIFVEDPDDEDEEIFSEEFRKILPPEVADRDDLFGLVCRGVSILSQDSHSENKTLSYEDWQRLIAENPQRLLNVPPEMMDYALAKLAVSERSTMILKVPEKLIDKALCERALSDQEERNLIAYLPTECIDRQMWERAITRGISYSDIPADILDDELTCLFIKTNGWRIDEIDPDELDRLLTLDLCVAALHSEAGLYDIPIRFHTTELALALMGDEPESLHQIPGVLFNDVVYAKAEQRFSGHPQWQSIISQHACSEEMLENNFQKIWAYYLNEELCLSAVEEEVRLWKIPLMYRTEKVCIAAVETEHNNLKWVPEDLKSLNMCKEAVEEDGLLLRFVPEKLRTIDVIVEAVSEDGKSLQSVPMNMRSKHVCAMALIDSLDAFTFIPDDLVIEVLEDILYTADEYKKPDLLHLLAKHYLKIGNSKKAINYTNEAIDGDSWNPEYFLTRARALLVSGDTLSAGFDLLCMQLIDEYKEFKLVLKREKSLAEAMALANSELTEANLADVIKQRPFLVRLVPKSLLSEQLIRVAYESLPESISEINKELIPKDLLENKSSDNAQTSKAMDYFDRDTRKPGLQLFLLKLILKAALRPAIKAKDARGLVKWLAERPLAFKATGLLVSLVTFVIHLFIVVDIWSDFGWGWGLLSLIGFWFAEIYWVYHEIPSQGISMTALFAMLLIVVWPIWAVISNRVIRAML